VERDSRRAQTSAHSAQSSGADGDHLRATGRLGGMEIRPVSPAEWPEFLRATEAAFHDDVHADDLETYGALFEPERSLAAFDGDAIAGTTAIFTRELTVPGAVVRAAGVTMVGVLPTHRRRGVLTALMRRQLDDVRAAGESVAALWASEAAIYGRFGYGLAARHAIVTLHTTGARLAPGVPTPGGRMRLLEPGDAIERIAPLYDRVRRERPGHLDRAGAWWTRRVHDAERHREGRAALRAAVHETAAGDVDGYALYAVKHGWEDGPAGVVHVRELIADGPEATVALWDYLLGIDLTRTVQWRFAPPDEPLSQLIAGPQLERLVMGPNLWIRLVDVPAALAARRYAAPLDVVFEVDDAFCPWNAGHHRLAAVDGRAACERTDAPADIACSAADLGAAYAGGTTLAALHAIGRVRELRPGAVERASLAFGAAREPWCPEVF
jgi:predicted acetyltransferase